LVLKMHEVSVVPPQTVGPFTPLYKLLVSRLKFFPVVAILPFSLFLIFIAYIFFGVLLVSLASVLQASF